jgi:hypothetical protein
MSVKEDYLGNRVNSRGWGGGTKEWWGVNMIKVHYTHVWKCHNESHCFN